MGLIGLLLLLSAAPDAIVGVESSSVAGGLAELLRLELGPDRVAPLPRAELWARVDEAPEGWRLTVRMAEGPAVLVRVLSLADGEGPALRGATWLITEGARGAGRDPSPPPADPGAAAPDPAPAPEVPIGPRPFTQTSTRAPRPFGLRLALGPSLGLWRSPLSPRVRVAIQGGLEHPRGFLAVAAELGAGPGLEEGGIAADLVETHWRAELGAVVWSGPGLRGLLVAGVGYGRYEGEARALVYADPGTVTSVGTIGLLELIAGLELRWAVGNNLDLVGRLGARFGVGEGEIALPAGFSEGPGLRLERLEPTVMVGLGWRII